MRRLSALALVLVTLAVTVGSSPAAAAGPTAPPIVARFGTTAPGTADGEYDGPRGIAVAANGDVFVADSGNDRIQRLSATGVHEATFGTTGTGNGELENPFSLAMSPDGDLLVADTGNSRVQRFSPNGAYLGQFGTPGGVAVGTFGGLNGIAVGPDGRIYTIEAAGRRVQRFDADGSNPAVVVGGGDIGSGDGEFNGPEGVAIGPDGDIYVADTGNDRIQQFTADGTFIRAWGTTGTGDGEFDTPVAVAVDGDGDVWVSDQGNDRLQVFTADGTFRFVVGGPGSQPGQFTGPYQIAIGARGSVWVADTFANQLHWFARPLTDARIKRGNAGPLAGNNRYNTTGANQTRSGSARGGGTVTYYVSVQNDVPEAEAFRLKGQGSTPRFTVRYFQGATNVTGPVLAGTYTTPVLDAGETSTLRVRVTVKRTAPRGSSLTRTVTARADSDTTRADKVRFVTSRS